MKAQDEIVKCLVNTLEVFHEVGLLSKYGYYSLSESYDEIIDKFKPSLAMTKTFKCCDKIHEYHILQPYVYCSICNKINCKNTTLDLNDNYRLARKIVEWLGINPQTLPKWNKECEEPEVLKKAKLSYENCSDPLKIDEAYENYIRLKYHDDQYEENMKLWWTHNKKIWEKNNGRL
jgi:hypothetical protein